MGVNMTNEDKQKECDRICGDDGKHGMHSIAPELCPIKEDEWKNPKRKPEYSFETPKQ
jgi:hypothetical protein